MIGYRLEFENWYRDANGDWDFDLISSVFNTRQQLEEELKWRNLRNRTDATYWIIDLSQNKVVETNGTNKIPGWP